MHPTLLQSPRAGLLALAALASIMPLAHRTRAAEMLVSREAAARLGLERAWFAQVPLDPSRTRATAWLLYFDTLYCVTDAGIVTALNAETGAELWSRQVGRPGVPAFGPDANDKYLGVVSGAELYMLDRHTGRLKWRHDLGSAPSSGPALSNDYAFVALVTGRIEGYKLDDPKALPWYAQSKGRTHLRPTTTGDVVSWPTTEGYVYVSGADEPGVRFRMETKADIVTSPAELKPYIYLASLDGYLYCVDERNGREQWRYATGYPIMSSPAIVGVHTYVASIEPALHCLDSKTGARLWSAPGVSHFGAEGRERVYATDRYGNLLVLDTATGTPIAEMRTAEGTSTLVNDKTDRLFLVNDHGLVQCLREIGAVEPTLHRKLEPADAKSDADGAEGEEANPFETEEPAPGEESPFETEEAAVGDEPPADDAEQPAEPQEDAAEEDNVFGN
jgi:outer membrane protein assembly factor BamB